MKRSVYTHEHTYICSYKCLLYVCGTVWNVMWTLCLHFGRETTSGWGKIFRTMSAAATEFSFHHHSLCSISNHVRLDEYFELSVIALFSANKYVCLFVCMSIWTYVHAHTHLHMYVSVKRKIFFTFVWMDVSWRCLCQRCCCCCILSRFYFVFVLVVVVLWCTHFL